MSLIDNIKIYNTEHTKIRLGNKSDGGYIILDEPAKNCEVLYSYGVSDDVSFEMDFVKRYPNAKARLFDFTINKLPDNHENFSFLSQGIASFKNEKFDTLTNHISYFNDTDAKNKILKMDIEWNEWDVFDNFSDFTLNQFSQILCEFHFIPVTYKDSHTKYFTGFHEMVYENINKILFAKYKKTLARIFENYYLYHIHINNSLPLINHDGKQFPPLVEMSLINKKLVSNPTICNTKFPISDLDYPNKSYKSDVFFDWSNS